MARRPTGTPRGFTLVELSCSVVLVGLLAGLTLPRFAGWRDRIAVDAAAASTMAQRGVFFGGALICQTFNAGTLARYQAARGARSG